MKREKSEPPPIGAKPSGFVVDYPVILQRARDTVASWGGKLVFVYLPDVHNLRGAEHAYRSITLQLAREAGFDSHMVKPVDLKKVLELLTTMTAME